MYARLGLQSISNSMSCAFGGDCDLCMEHFVIDIVNSPVVCDCRTMFTRASKRIVALIGQRIARGLQLQVRGFANGKDIQFGVSRQVALPSIMAVSCAPAVSTHWTTLLSIVIAFTSLMNA